MNTNHRFNSPAEMAARLIYVAHLLFILVGVVVLVGRVVRADLPGCAWGGLMLFAGVMCRLLLHARGRLADVERSMETFMDSDTGPGLDGNAPEVAEFLALLERRAEVELLRGTPAFDPWEILSLQHQMDECLRRHPELSLLFKARETP